MSRAESIAEDGGPRKKLEGRASNAGYEEGAAWPPHAVGLSPAPALSSARVALSASATGGTAGGACGAVALAPPGGVSAVVGDRRVAAAVATDVAANVAAALAEWGGSGASSGVSNAAETADSMAARELGETGATLQVRTPRSAADAVCPSEAEDSEVMGDGHPLDIGLIPSGRPSGPGCGSAAWNAMAVGGVELSESSISGLLESWRQR